MQIFSRQNNVDYHSIWSSTGNHYRMKVPFISNPCTLFGEFPYFFSSIIPAAVRFNIIFLYTWIPVYILAGKTVTWYSVMVSMWVFYRREYRLYHPPDIMIEIEWSLSEDREETFERKTLAYIWHRSWKGDILWFSDCQLNFR